MKNNGLFALSGIGNGNGILTVSIGAGTEYLEGITNESKKFGPGIGNPDG